MKALAVLVFACAQLCLPSVAAPVKGQAEAPQLAPVFSPNVTQAPVILQPAKAISLPAAAAAGDSGPTINIRLPVTKIGSLSLNGAEALIQNGVVDIRSLNDPSSPLLLGRVLRIDDAGTDSGNQRQMSGLVLFLSGQMLDQLCQAPSSAIVPAAENSAGYEELVFRKSGSLSGQIIDVRPDRLVLQSRGGSVPIPLNSVSYVRSPRAYLFTITGKPSADMTRTRVQSVSFRPTLQALGLGDELVIGKPSDAIADDDELILNPTPPSITRMRQVENDNFGPSPGRSFPSWP